MSLPAPTSKPVISPIQSVIGYLQWQAFEFQMTATPTADTGCGSRDEGW